MKNHVNQIWGELANGSPYNFSRKLYNSKCKYKLYCIYDGFHKHYGISISYGQKLKINVDRLNAFKHIHTDIKNDPAFSDTNMLLVTFIDSSDSEQKEIMAELCQNILEYVENQKDECSAVHAFINQLLRWDEVFSKTSRKGLSPSEQRGLFGELYLLERLLAASPSTFPKLLDSWVGPEARVQDFQCDNWAVEVKTSTAANPQNLKINGERQLDDDLQQNLFLFHVSLQEGQGSGESLNDKIKKIRDLLVNDLSLLVVLNMKLNDVGYFDSESYLYEDTHYLCRDANYYKVEGDFPRIKEKDLKVGVGDITYSISISSCEKYKYSEDDFFVLISKM